MAITARMKLFVELLGSLQWRVPFIPTPYESAPASGDVFEYPIPDGTVNQLLSFPPGVSTITMLAITTDSQISVTLGTLASNQGKTLNPGGIWAMAGIAIAATNTVYLTFNPGTGATATVVIAYAGT